MKQDPMPQEHKRDGVFIDAAPLNRDAWQSSAGDSGYGRLPRRTKQLVPYDASLACLDFPPKDWSTR